MPNIFDSPPARIPTEIFDLLAANEHVQIKRIISRGHSSPASGWYEQSDNEWVLLLKGEALLTFADGSSQRLGSGDFLNIPAHTKHRVAWTAPDQDTVWLAVHFDADGATDGREPDFSR
ncbi:MAG: cupin domain-containing protein [Pseudomonadales bacterium]|nr:cupin domain-containing protein [Pseudomonadales bacterium]